MSREAFERLFPVPEGVEWRAETYTAKSSWYAVNAAHQRGLWRCWNVLHPEIDELVEALEEAKAKLVDYADEDAIAGGYGAGVFCNPDGFIKDVAAKAERLIAKHRGKDKQEEA